MELTGWECAPSTPGTVVGPDGLAAAALDWVPAEIPGTAASAWTTAGRVVDPRDVDFDEFDWWFRTTFDRRDLCDGTTLRFDGVATLAEVWVDGVLTATNDNMFAPFTVTCPKDGPATVDLVVACRSLRAALAQKRPRPRWKANFVRDQNLRWFRTSLLGRMPSWTAPCAPVGLWRPVVVERPRELTCAERSINASWVNGTATIALTADVVTRSPIRSATLVVAGARLELAVGTASSPSDAAEPLVTTLSLATPTPVAGAEAWWPCTHGQQPRYPLVARCTTDDGTVDLELGTVGFRTIAVETGAAPSVAVNGVPVFVRGVWWNTPDPVGVNPTAAETRGALQLLRDAGCNMVAIPASALYETDQFFDLCDELGILVWQQLMFTRLDYPVDDEAWNVNVRREIDAVTATLSGHPSVAVVCGGFEVAQQVAMLGLDIDAVSWFDGDLRELVAVRLPGIAYLADTPHGGTHSFTVNEGTATYYGIGAYDQPLDDARRSGLKFATGCLAFSNVPDDTTTERFVDGGAALHGAAWKRAIPRDHGAAWDMEDTRDAYVRRLYDVDPSAVRRVDADRYLDLGRAATSRAMAAAMTEWRLPRSECRGALVLQGRDFVVGAGAGIVDATGRPKANYYALRRVLCPISVLWTDEGLSGLDTWVVNDGPESFSAVLEIAVFSSDRVVALGAVACEVGARSTAVYSAEQVLGAFLDVSHAFRFGPRSIVGAVATLRSAESGLVVARSTHRLDGPLVVHDAGLTATLRATGEGHFALAVSARSYAHFVQVSGSAWCSDQGFDIEPGGSLEVEVLSATRPRLRVRALNGVHAAAPEFVDD